MQATFILHALQANVSVYGSNSAFSGAQPADVDLALKYIDRCLETWPNNPKYLNLKALFLIEGKGDKAGGLALMEKAAALAPDDITIQDNFQKSKQDNCFIATCVFNSEAAPEVVALRRWRDRALAPTPLGHRAISFYYSVGPTLSLVIGRGRYLKGAVRTILRFLVAQLPRAWSIRAQRGMIAAS